VSDLFHPIAPFGWLLAAGSSEMGSDICGVKVRRKLKSLMVRVVTGQNVTERDSSQKKAIMLSRKNFPIRSVIPARSA